MGKSSRARRRTSAPTAVVAEKESLPPASSFSAPSDGRVITPSCVKDPRAGRLYAAVDPATCIPDLTDIAGSPSSADPGGPGSMPSTTTVESVFAVMPTGQVMNVQPDSVCKDIWLREQVPPFNYPHGLLAAIFSYMIHFNKQAPPQYEGSALCGVTYEEVIAGLRDQYPEDIRAIEQDSNLWMAAVQNLLSNERIFLHASDRFATSGSGRTTQQNGRRPRIFYCVNPEILNEAMAIKRGVNMGSEVELSLNAASGSEPAAHERRAVIADVEQAEAIHGNAVEVCRMCHTAMEKARTKLEEALSDAAKARNDALQARGVTDQLVRELDAARDKLDSVRAERDKAIRKTSVLRREIDEARDEVAQVRASSALEADELRRMYGTELEHVRAERDRHLAAARKLAAREQFLRTWIVANQTKIHEKYRSHSKRHLHKTPEFSGS